jgi:transposase
LPDWRGPARRRFGIQTQHLHIDTTSFSVSGDYAIKEEGDPVPLAITYGYSRDHRQDLKQWMLALATTHDGDVPIFLKPLDGNSGD